MIALQLNLLKLKPDFLIKGGDWLEDDIVGSGFVKKIGGKGFSIPLKQIYQLRK